MYVNQLRWLSFVGHDLKEPFSLLAKDIPAPELPPELDELAQKRALQYFRVILLTVSTLSVGLPIISPKKNGAADAAPFCDQPSRPLRAR